MKQILVHGERQLLETAVLVDGRLVEYDRERPAGRQGVGNLYKGRIVNVLPGMQAAFVDIGQGKNAFLYIDDMLHPQAERHPRIKPSVTELAKPGQELIVQVVKEPISGKGARVTTHYSLPGRRLVYMPTADYVGVSKKIAAEPERARLRDAAESIRQPGEGIILRTAAEGGSAEELDRDLAEQRRLWADIAALAGQQAAPCELHREAGLATRLVRDFLNDETDEVWVDDPGALRDIAALVRLMAPQLEPLIRPYVPDRRETLFDRYGVVRELDKALGPRTRLPSGGDLVWDRTEALTVVDVNTGRFTGTVDLEDTVFRTNMEAASEIARLLRLRDVGGIILVDFIDMETDEHRDQVYRRLEKLTRQDRVICNIHGWTRLGLLEITRKKARENAAERLYETCEVCGGRGKVPAGTSVHRFQ